MSKRKFVFLIGGVLAVLVVVTLLVIILVKVNNPQPLQPPELGGQKVPSKVFEISFEKRYDLFCGFFKEEPTMFRNCKILGFTGTEEQETGSREVFSSEGSYKERGYFNHWLVIELPDERRVYIPPQSIKYIEEAAGK